MAAILVTKSVKATYVLNGGTNPETGKALSKSVTFNGLRSNPSADTVSTIGGLLAPVLLYPITRMETTEVKTVETN